MSVSQGGASAGKPARKENYWDMWKTTFCPQFSIVSFTFMCWLINTVVYLASLVFMVGPNRELNERVFLGPDLRTLHAWGALDRYEIKENWQVWRLFTSLFLSIGFSVFMISSGALLVIGFIAENQKMTKTRMALLYYGSGILGNLFSICVQNEVSVGPMTSIMALVSGLLGGVIVNWKALAGAGMFRICLMFMLVFLFVILLVLSANAVGGSEWEGISMTGQAGGFMAGICMGLMLFPHALERDSPFVGLVRKIGALLTLIYCGVLLPVFIFSVDVSPTYWAKL